MVPGGGGGGGGVLGVGGGGVMRLQFSRQGRTDCTSPDLRGERPRVQPSPLCHIIAVRGLARLSLCSTGY